MSNPLASPAESRGRPSTPSRSSSRGVDPWGVIAPEPFACGLRLLPLSPGAWRLCDGEAAPDDATSVIAYLERDDSGIDVVWLQGASRREHYPSIEDVLAAARRLADHAAPPTGPTRPTPIPHFAPPTQ